MVLVCLTGACGAAEPPLAIQRQAIVNGEAAAEDRFPNVGLLHGRERECTATLIGRQTILTAAHCEEDAADLRYITPSARSIRLQAFVPHPDYRPLDSDSGELPRADLALGYLTQEAEETPAALAEDPPEPGEDLVLVGWGMTEEDAEDGGTQRWAVNDVEDLVDDLFAIEDASWGEGSTCQGDSGGPAFAERDGEQRVLGVHATTNCYESSWIFFDASSAHEVRVDVYFDWIAARIDDPEVLDADEAETSRPGESPQEEATDDGSASTGRDRRRAKGDETIDERDPFAGVGGCRLSGPASSPWWIPLLLGLARRRQRPRR